MSARGNRIDGVGASVVPRKLFQRSLRSPSSQIRSGSEGYPKGSPRRRVVRAGASMTWDCRSQRLRCARQKRSLQSLAGYTATQPADRDEGDSCAVKASVIWRLLRARQEIHQQRLWGPKSARHWLLQSAEKVAVPLGFVKVTAGPCVLSGDGRK